MRCMYTNFLDTPNMKDDSVIKEDGNSISNKTEIVMVGGIASQVSGNIIMLLQETQQIDVEFYSQELSNQSISPVTISS